MPLEAMDVLAAAERFPWAVAAPGTRHWPDGGDFLDVALSAVRPEEREGYVERLEVFVEQHRARLEEMLRTHGPGSTPGFSSPITWGEAGIYTDSTTGKPYTYDAKKGGVNMGIDLRIEGDGVIGRWSDWMEDKTEEFDRLDVLYEKWSETYATSRDYPYGAIEFLGWLKKRGMEVEGPHWSGKVETEHTSNFISWIDEALHFTMFKLGEQYFVAVSGPSHVKDPNFFRLTCAEPDEFRGFASAWMECDGGHAYETQDTERWQRYIEGVGPRGPKIRLYDLDKDGDGDLLCPKCTNKIRKVGAY